MQVKKLKGRKLPGRLEFTVWPVEATESFKESFGAQKVFHLSDAYITYVQKDSICHNVPTWIARMCSINSVYVFRY